MNKSNTKYELGERCKGIKYSQIAHNKSAIIWWYMNSSIRTHVSKGDEFHTEIIRARERKEPDLFWRGRSTANKHGVVTVLMPTKEYVKKFRIPEKVVKAIKRTFMPKIILINVKNEELRVLEKIRQKSKNTDTISNHRGRI